MNDDLSPNLDDLDACFRSSIPVVIATASLENMPNVTYVSKIHRVDDERVAISNQFLGKTARNIAANPRASLLVVEPRSYHQYRVDVTFERTDRRGPVFERLRAEIDALAAMEGVTSAFRLRSADIFRVREITPLPSLRPDAAEGPADAVPAVSLRSIVEALERLSRTIEADLLQQACLHTSALLPEASVRVLRLDGDELITIAGEGLSELRIAMGSGPIGTAAQRCEPIRLDSALLSSRYARSVQRADTGQAQPDPVNDDDALVKSVLAVPALVNGELVGVLAAESTRALTFSDNDSLALRAIAAVIAPQLAQETTPRDRGSSPSTPKPKPDRLRVRFHRVDGSIFFGDDYVIRGLSGEILAYLLIANAKEGRTSFTNRELRLAPDLDVPGLRQSLESRLATLIKRLDEHAGPIRIAKTARGRFDLVVDEPFAIEVLRAG